jgi:predicted Holliday junction resolvase-like endonuclease
VVFVLVFEFQLLFFILVLVVALLVLAKLFFDLKKSYSDLLFDKRSQSVKYGQLTEQWIPFSERFPFDSQNFRFIGKPIDGISFENDKIVFVEFKTNKSNLNAPEKRTKQLVMDKKVEWFELRVD